MSTQARVAKRYSKAFVNAVIEKGNLEQEMAYLKGFCELQESDPLLGPFLMNVTVKAKVKMDVINEICEQTKASDLAKRFLVLLAAKGRLDCLEEIQNAVVERVNHIQNIKDITVSTSTPLSDESRGILTEALAEKLASQIRLEEKVNPEIWGGAVVRIGSTVFDGSLKGKLKRLRDELVKEN